MRKTISIFFLISILLHANFICVAQVSGPSLDVEPIPLFDQILHGEKYTFIVKFNSTGNSIEQGEAITGQPGLVYTGNCLVSLTLGWRGKGSYDFGDATTGYTYNLDNAELNRSLTFPEPGSTIKLHFNYSFERDSFQFGMKPYEDIEIITTISIYYEARNSSSGIIVKGPKIDSISTEYYLLDDIQVDYLQGKYNDMRSEIVNLDKFEFTQTFQKSRYYNILEQMNSTLHDGNYLEAKEIYLDYDEDSKADLISDLASEVNSSLQRIEELKGLREEVANLKTELEICELDYENLESRYSALSNAYQGEQAELEALRRNLTTAITAVFLASVLFFFLGRRSITINQKISRGES